MRDPIIPASPALEERLAGRVAGRLAGAARALRRAAPAAALSESAAVVGACRDALASLPRAARIGCLTGPEVRGFVGEVATWSRAFLLARRRDPSRARLFDLVSRTEFLAVLAPQGRVDPGFPDRVARFAVERLRQAIADLAAFTIGMRLAHPGVTPLRLTLAFREDAEQGRPGDRIDLGTVAGAAGPLGIARRSSEMPRPRRRAGRGGRAPAPIALRAELRGRLLILVGPGSGRLALPAAGSPLRLPEDRPLPAGRAARHGRRRARFPLVRRETIPGTGILLAPVVVSRPFRLRVGRPLPGLGARLARALRLLNLCWPEGYRSVVLRTRMVVPVREPGTVSWSLQARPGISFINVFGKSLVDLADDLLHETAHHLLHDREEVERLLVPGPETGEVQAFHSPWRRSRRPLHGLLHATFTFSFRAELLSRLREMARRRPLLARRILGRRGVAWVGRELGREKRMLAASLRDLGRAARAGLLTEEGRRLTGDLRAWHRRMAPADRRRGPAAADAPGARAPARLPTSAPRAGASRRPLRRRSDGRPRARRKSRRYRPAR